MVEKSSSTPSLRPIAPGWLTLVEARQKKPFTKRGNGLRFYVPAGADSDFPRLAGCFDQASLITRSEKLPMSVPSHAAMIFIRRWWPGLTYNCFLLAFVSVSHIRVVYYVFCVIASKIRKLL